MSRLLARFRGEEGVTLVLAVTMMAVLSVLSITLYEIMAAESHRSYDAVARDASFQAAEAGINTYVAKLVDDPQFFSHYLIKGESTRLSGSGTTVAGSATANVAWTAGTTWTYPGGFGNWRSLGNGYEYSLQITPPSNGSSAIGIIAVGRPTGSTTNMRKIQSLVRQAGVTDFQMLANADISYGSAATTRGKIYAGRDSGGTNHNVSHSGTAYANIYAEGQVTGATTMMGTAKKFDSDSSPTIRTEIANPINFASFLTSLVDIQAAAQSGGAYFNDSTKAAWWLKFSNDGTFTAQSCTKSGSSNVEDVTPVCGTATTYTVPSNGAIYTAQSAIVSNATTSGGVRGRVTVGSNNDVVVAGDINPVTAGTDVLGLVAASDVFIAQYVPSNLNWTAGTISQSGTWQSAPNASNGSHGTMTFTGSSTTAQGGQMSMFSTRVYQYDDTLLYLQPPWFPRLGDAVTITLFRELTP